MYQFCQLGFDQGTSYATAKPIIQKRITALVDARGKRSQFMSLGSIIFEQFLSFCILYNWYVSALEAFEPAPIPLGYRNPECKKALFMRKIEKAAGYIAGDDDMQMLGLSEYEKLQMCYTFSGNLAYLAAMEEELLFTNSAGTSKFVALLLMIRLMEVLNFSRYFRWLPDTMSMAFWKLVNFLIVYFLVVVGLSVIFTARFGAMYAQFRSISQSVLALLFFSFGDTERAMDGVHPFIEDSGTMCSIWLLCFTVCITTIGLGFFTTIVLDAYTIVSDSTGQADVDGLLDDLSESLAPYFGCKAEEANSEENTKKEPSDDAAGRDSIDSKFGETY